jgi:hypothetical protein
MPRFRSLLFLSLVITVIVGISLTALYLLFTNDYTEFISWFLNRIHKPHLLKSASSFLSQQQFLMLRIVAVVLAFAVFGLLLFTYKKRQFLLARITLLIDRSESVITGFFKNLVPAGKFHRALFFFLVTFYLIRTTISIFYYPIDFDEADTYMLFSSQGPLVAATFYPLPNNHILFSIITSITSLLPVDPVYALRLPLLPIGFLVIISMFGFLKKHFTDAAALLGLSFFIAAYPLFIYSFLARGYLLLLFFYVVALYAIFELCFSNGHKKRHSYLLVLASVGGLYTIPSFLYALAGLYLFAFTALVLQKNNAAIVRLIKNGFVIGLLAAILYLPVLISIKWSLLKPYMTPVYDRANTLNVFTTTFGYLSKTFLSPVDLLAVFFGCCFLIGSLFLFRSKRPLNKAIVTFVLIQLILCIAVFFLFRQQFPAKPWMHFTVVVAFLATAIINLMLEKTTIRPVLLFLAIILLLSSGTIASYFYKKENIATGYNSVAKQCERLLIEQKVKEVYTGIPYYKTMIDYYALKNKLQVSLSNSRTTSRLYAPFDPQKKYDLIIVPLQKSKLPPLLYSYDTVIQAHNTAVLLIRR